MRCLIFAKRNIIELIRTPLNLFFTVLFPVVMFLIFQLIVFATGVTKEQVPMFNVENLVVSISVFSFAFLALNVSMIIAKDRETSFQSRLMVSPMRPIDFLVGYLLPQILLALVQTVLMFVLGVIFGLKITISIIPTLFSLFVISVFYICLGLIIGSIFTDKSSAGVSSILVNVTAIFGGMFFPLADGTFKTVLSFFPFLPTIAFGQGVLNGITENLLQYGLTVLGYLIITLVISVLIFYNRIKKGNK